MREARLNRAAEVDVLRLWFGRNAVDQGEHRRALTCTDCHTGNAEMIKPIGLKPRFKLQLFNGPIECRLLVFDLYGGTKRDRRLKRAPEQEQS